MARTKGSLNRATIAKQQAAVSTKLDVDKHGNLTRGNTVIGKVEYAEGFFRARVGSSLFAGFFLEDLLDKVKEAGV